MKKIITMCVSACLVGCVSFGTEPPLTTIQLEQMWPEPIKNAKMLVAKMSMREKIGQLLMLDIRHWDNRTTGFSEEDKDKNNVVELPKILSNTIHNYHLGGIVLFRENFITTAQTYKLTNKIQNSRYRVPLLIGTDQEGGYVTRLREGTEMPGNMALAATGNISMAQNSGKIHGVELAALGININFSPVVDININQNNPIIGVRSYSSDISIINNMANAYINGLQSQKVTATIKHFPGHGNVATDSHIGLPVVPYSESEWRENDLMPFKFAINNDIKAIMTGHIVVPALDDSKVISKRDGLEIGLPSTLSKKIINGLLRDELNYKELIFSDALDMGAITDNFGANEAVEWALLAGVDIAVMPIRIWDKQNLVKLENLYSYLEKKSQINPELTSRINESATRVLKYKLEHKLSPQPNNTLTHALSIVASTSHKDYEQSVAEQSVTLIENQAVLPYPLKAKNRVLIVSDEKARNEIINRELMLINTTLQDKQIKTENIALNLAGAVLPIDLDNMIHQNDFIILVTYNLKTKGSAAQQIIDRAAKQAKPLVLISSRNPYDISALTNVKANIAIYGITGFDITNAGRNSLEANIRAGVSSLFIDNNHKEKWSKPKGKLPVDIKNDEGKVIYPLGHGLAY